MFIDVHDLFVDVHEFPYMFDGCSIGARCILDRCPIDGQSMFETYLKGFRFIVDRYPIEIQ